MTAFFAWLKSLFSSFIELKALPEAEESFKSPTYGVPVGSSKKTISTGQDPDEGQLDWYRKMYNAMSLRSGTEAITIAAAKKVLAGFTRYKAVQDKTGVPWFVIGCIHLKECSGRFDQVLHNGELLTSVNARGTILIPTGYGKGKNWTWEEAAIHAISLGGGRWEKIRSGAKDIGTILFTCERYNGTGHLTGAGRAAVSPYIWDCTNVYLKGRYTSDGKWDANFIGNKSAGVAGILRYLEGVKSINVQSAALVDAGVIPSVPVSYDTKDIGQGLTELAKTVGFDPAQVTKMIEFQVKDRPGRNPRYWAMMNVALKSSTRRLAVFDRLEKSVTLYHVAHGSGSDQNHDGLAEKFSNVSGSNCTSVGLYRVAETYVGKHGLSAKLDGKEATNSNARARAIVLHGASYVEPEYVAKNGKAGRSQGCPAVADSVSKDLVTKLSNGSLLLIYKG